MLRQYYAQRRCGGNNPLGVGVIGVGSVYYLQEPDCLRPSSGRPTTFRVPYIVEAFLNGTVGASRRNRDTGLWESTTFAGRSDTAVVRSLRNGRRETVSVRLLILHEDLGLWRDPNPYPSMPALRLYRRGQSLAGFAIAPCARWPRRDGAEGDRGASRPEAALGRAA